MAEGVETQVQADYLKARKVDFQQGYLYGRPMPMTVFASQLPARRDRQPEGPRLG